MKRHPPKQLAIEAWVRNQLSGSAAGRLERHLVQCSVCRDLAESAQLYESLRRESRAISAPEPSWEALARRLDATEDQAAGSPGGARRRWLALAGSGLAAALALLAWLAWSPGSSTAPAARQARTPETRAVKRPSRLVGRITLVMGDVRLRGADGAEQPVDLGTPLGEGDSLLTGDGAQVHVRLAHGTGFALDADSALRAETLRQGQIRLGLQRGVVTSRVAKQSADERYEVAAGDLLVAVRGTHFTVRQIDGTEVVVHEGLVSVFRGDVALAMLGPGQRLRVPEQQGARAAAADLRAVHGLDPALPLGTIQLPRVSGVRAWLVDDVPLPATAALAMRLPLSQQSLSFRDLAGRVHTLPLALDDSQLSLDLEALRRLLAPRRVQRDGYLAPAQIRKVIKAGVGRLRRCYERDLRRMPSLEGQLRLSIRIAPDGQVARAHVSNHPALSDALRQCLVQEARRWRFPRPAGGGGVSFEVPLNLRAAP